MISDILEHLYVFKAEVLRVIDGDTLEAKIDLGFNTYAIKKIRLLSVDTPEKKQENYEEAKEFTAQRVEGKEVYIQTYKTEAFGRYLGNVFYIDSNEEIKLLNIELLMAGLVKKNSKWNKKHNE